MPSTPPVVLTFAASDPSGGAGIQADLMTLSATGCHALSVMTALTVQDTRGVDDIFPVAAVQVDRQARRLLEDMHVDVFKIGVLGSVENIRIVTRILLDYSSVPVVLDPVLASGRGDRLADENMIALLRDSLLPLTTVLTPNTIEAHRLARKNADDEENPLSPEACAYRLLDHGCAYILLTGTHENSPDVTNRLFDKTGLIRGTGWKRLPGSYHGSGCTLASALASGLAHGLSVPDASDKAQDYTWQTLANAFCPGKGQFIPNRFYSAFKSGDIS